MKKRFVKLKKLMISKEEIMLRLQIGVYKLFMTKKSAIKVIKKPEVKIQKAPLIS
jgi:hypothetical protein